MGKVDSFAIQSKNLTVMNSSTGTAIQNLAQRQVMLSLSYLAYCGEKITTANPEKQILALINEAIPNIAPVADWQVVWGPVAYTTPGALYQDDMMYVAQNQTDKTQFAVAIRGTNSVSELDWLMEDLDVMQMMPWPMGSTSQTPVGEMISESTSIDMQILLGMESPIYNGSSSNTPISLLDFLQSQTADAINLCVTGHSLGGCLAGTLALYLQESRSLWDQSATSTLTAITFAAPTAGNDSFATYSDAQFSGQPMPPDWDSSLGTNFDAVRCTLDVAPMAWMAAELVNSAGTSSPVFSVYVVSTTNHKLPQIDFSQMEDLYGYAWTDVVIPDILPMIANEVSPLNYQQTVANAVQLTGTFNPAYAAYDQSFEQTFEAFIDQAGYQHSQSYPTILGVTELLNSSVFAESAATPARRPFNKTLLIKAMDRLIKYAPVAAVQTEKGSIA